MKPRQLVQDFEPQLKEGSVIDFGSGSGKDIAYLKSKGYTVRGVDKDSGETIQDWVDTQTENWDNMMSFFTIHFMSSAYGYKTYKWMKDHTNSGGLNLIGDFTTKITWENPKGFYVGPNELKELYSDWEVLYYKENHVPAYDGSQQMAAFLVARKK